MNLATAFKSCAEKHARKTAIFWGDREIPYSAVDEQSQRVAAHLRDQFGVKPGDRVALWLKNCPEFVPAVFGILQAGGVIVPVNNFLKPAEVAFILKDSGAKGVISDASLTEAHAQVANLLPGLKILSAETIASGQLPMADFKLAERAEADLAALLYTSGTTGHPKGAMLTHGNFLHNVASCVEVLDVRADDRVVVALPQFHSFMFTVGTLLPCLTGCGIVLIKTLNPFKSLLEEIARHRGTIMPSVPAFYRTVLAVPEFGRLPLRLCISGGAPLPADVFNKFSRSFSFPLREGYGPTESSPVATVNPIYGENRPGSVGTPIPNVELSIRDDSGGELPVGATGEICIRGGNVMLGYWNQPEETAKVLRNGWLLTGDMGHRDADGYYYITDRKKDMLIVNGINVYPREIEEVIYQFPGVKEAAVIGVPDARRGEQAVAFVAAAEGHTLDEKALLQFIRGQLADYKIPKQIFIIPALPKNATGKILKTELRKQAAK